MAACTALVLAWPVLVDAQAQSLGTVRLTQAAVANGQPLPAGSYTVRTTTDPVTAVVGQSADGARWVEFVQGGQSRGKELATVLSGEAVAAVTGGGGPASGSSKVELLKGGDYLRVWINRGGTHYLVHLSVQAR